MTLIEKLLLLICFILLTTTSKPLSEFTGIFLYFHLIAKVFNLTAELVLWCSVWEDVFNKIKGEKNVS